MGWWGFFLFLIHKIITTTMKKYFLMLAVALATGMMFTSCSSDDDEDGGGSGKSSAGQLDDGRGNHELPEGYRLASVGNDFRYYYDEQGYLESFYADGDTYDFSTKGISFSDEGVEMKATFNGNGFISKLSGSYETTYDGAKMSATESGSVSYNSNKQITSITGSYKETGSYEGQKYSETENISINFSYSGKRLSKVVWKTNYSSPYGKGSETYTYTFEYNNEYENPYGQWTHYLTYCLPESDFFEALAYVGCFGRATAVLPDVIYEEEEDVDEDGTSTDKDTYHCSYTFNTYGALRKADGYEYKYTTVTPDDNHVKATRAADESVLKPFVQTEKPRHHRFLRHRRK